MQTYELTYIISSDITLENAQAKARELEATIQQNSGVIVQQSNPAPKVLAYPVKKRGSGYIGSVEFQIESEPLAETEKLIAADPMVLRYIMLAKRTYKVKKERRVKPGTPVAATEVATPEAAKETAPAPKVEAVDIDKELDKLLGE